MVESFLELVRKAAKKKILFLPHALDQMNWANRLISPKEVRKVIFQGEIIEEYPEDPRGHSCLMLGYGENKRAIHVVCSPKEDFLALITSYLPDEAKWSSDYKTRV